MVCRDPWEMGGERVGVVAEAWNCGEGRFWKEYPCCGCCGCCWKFIWGEILRLVVKGCCICCCCCCCGCCWASCFIRCGPLGREGGCMVLLLIWFDMRLKDRLSVSSSENRSLR